MASQYLTQLSRALGVDASDPNAVLAGLKVARMALRLRLGGVDAAERHRLNLIAGTNVTITVTDDSTNDEVDVEISSTGGGGGAPTGADYLVGTADATLTNEIVVGATPGGELGGTWGSPTVDATHSGSTHQAATTTHEAAADPHTGYVLESLLDAKGDLYAATAADTVARLGVGADGTVLTAASGQATGMSWSAPGAGTHPGVVSHLKWGVEL